MDMSERIVRLLVSAKDIEKYRVITESEPSETVFDGYLTLETHKRRNRILRAYILAEYDPVINHTIIVKVELV